MEVQKKSWGEAASILLFLLPLLTSCEDKPAEHLPEQNSQLISRFEPWPVCATENCITRWSSLRILGMDAGTQNTQECHCHTSRGDRILVQSSGQFAFLRQGSKILQMAREKVLMDSRGRLLRYYRKEGQEDGSSTIVRAGKVDEELLTIRGPELIRSQYQTEALGGPLFQKFLFKSKTPVQGQEVNFKVFSHRTGGYSEQHIKVISASVHGGFLLDHRAQDAPGVISTMDLDKEFNIRRERSRFGKFTIESMALKRKPKKIIPDNLPDITRFMSVRTKGTMTHPESVCSAQYRIRDIPARIRHEEFKGPGQKILASGTDGTIELLVTAINTPSHDLASSSIPMDIKPFCVSTALLASDDPRIKNLAKEQTLDTQNPMDAALALRDWVASNIRSDMGMSFAPALEVLHTRRGDCSEKSVLLVALARSIGIPARAVIGLVFNGKEFAGHMWCEVWAGQWIPMDASFGPKAVSAARIRLGVDLLKMGTRNVSNTALTEVLTGGVSVDILKVSHWEKPGACPKLE